MSNFKNLQVNDAKGDLSKPWFISFYFLDPHTGKFVRRRETGDINRFKTVKERREALFTLKQVKEVMLNSGWSPFQQYDPEKFLEKSELVFTTLDEAIERVKKHKKLLLKPDSYISFKYKVEYFRSYMENRKLLFVNVKEVTKKYIVEFLDYKSTHVSIRTRNNILIDVKSMFSTMLDMELIDANPAERIKKFKCESERNVIYSPDELKKLFDWLRENNQYLFLYCKFIAYTFIRPVELTRLRVGDVDLENKSIRLSVFQTKNKSSDVLTIMDILIPEIEAMNLHLYPKDFFLFSSKLKPDKGFTTRDYFTDKFAIAKKALGLSKNHTMYSIKHTFVSELIRNGAREVDVRRMTRHKTSDAFQKHIRQFNEEKPADLSEFFKEKY